VAKTGGKSRKPLASFTALSTLSVSQLLSLDMYLSAPQVRFSQQGADFGYCKDKGLTVFCGNINIDFF
jgi:hypothetical protein